VLALCVAGAAIRFATLGEQSFWLDEAVTGRLMRLGFGGMLRAIPRSESTPPLYYILAWFWTRAFGVSEVGLRSLSALLGTLTIPLVYAAAARLFDRRAGIVAAALAAFAPLLIWYSQEARSYALLVALCAAGLWAFAAALEDGAGRRSLWLWALAGALALATHYFAVFVVGPELCWLAWKRGRASVPALAVVVLAGLAVAPLAVHQRANGGAGFIAETRLSTRLFAVVKQLAVGYDAPLDKPLIVLGGLLGLVSLWLAWRLRSPGRLLAVIGLGGLGAAALLVPALVAVGGYDYVITRNLIVAWVPVGLALAGVLSASGRAGAVVLAAVCAIGLAVTLGVDLNPRFQRDDWRGAVRLVPVGAPAALVVTPPSGRQAIEFYLRDARPLGPAGAKVASVEVIALGVRGVGDAVEAPPLPAKLPALAGFDAPVASQHATFDVIRYRAAGGSALVTVPMLVPLALVPTASLQLVTAGA
jgi:hypothetical protein